MGKNGRDKPKSVKIPTAPAIKISFHLNFFNMTARRSTGNIATAWGLTKKAIDQKIPTKRSSFFQLKSKPTEKEIKLKSVNLAQTDPSKITTGFSV